MIFIFFTCATVTCKTPTASEAEKREREREKKSTFLNYAMYSLILSRHSHLPGNTDINRHWIDVMTYLPVWPSVYSLCQFINAWKQCREWVRPETGSQLTCDICRLSMLLTIEHSCQWLYMACVWIYRGFTVISAPFVRWLGWIALVANHA